MLPSFIRIQDLADILIMTFLVYQLYTWFRKTRAMQVLLGLGVMMLVYFVTRYLDLYMTSWILQELGTVLVVLMIVVFQAEIRQALYRFSLLRNFFGHQQENAAHSSLQLIAETMFKLAERRTGALLVFNRSDVLADLVLNGVNLDCEVSSQILESIFADKAPLHDGAALVRDGRIAMASCHLPLSTNPDLPQYLGTRHRAALGLSERTDAIVLVVSEERGQVSLADGGEFHPMGSPVELVAALEGRINPVREKTRQTVRQKLFSNLLPKTAVLLMVTAFWALITVRQGQITTVNVPVRLHGIPDELILVKSMPEEVEVQLKSLSSLTPTPAKLDITANVDLSGVREGQVPVRIKNSDFSLPSGMTVSSVTPSQIRVVVERKARKTVPVRVSLKGGGNAGIQEQDVVVNPTKVEVEGPASQLSRLDSLPTEPIDADRLERGRLYEKSLLLPSKKVTLLRDEPVTIRVKNTRKK